MTYDGFFETDEQREGWQVTNAGEADWAVGMIKQARKDIARAEKKRDELIQSAKEIFSEETAPLENQIKFFTDKLKPYAEENLIGKSRSTKLPHGTLQFKKQGNKFVFDDGEVADGNSKRLLDWCVLNQAQAVKEKISYTVDWANFKKSLKIDGETVCTSDGEVIDGLKCIAQEDKFSVTTNDN